MPWNEFCMIRVIWEVSDGFSREVWSSSLPSDHDLTGGGSPPPKIEKNKFVLKWFLGNFKCFKLPPPPPLNGKFRFFFFFFNPSLRDIFSVFQKLLKMVLRSKVHQVKQDFWYYCIFSALSDQMILDWPPKLCERDTRRGVALITR